MPIYQYHGSVKFGSKGKLQKAVSKNGLISLPEKTGKELGLKPYQQETISDEFNVEKPKNSRSRKNQQDSEIETDGAGEIEDSSKNEDIEGFGSSENDETE